MRLATWNINSLRARTERVGQFLTRHDIDVLAIQETKVKDEVFPAAIFTDAGYQVAHHGFSQWNGVAIASRIGLEQVQIGFPGMPGWPDGDQCEARAITALCGGIEVSSLYIPNGRELDNPHYAYKLEFLAALRAYAAGRSAIPAMLCGDFNIAPLDEDVWDITVFEGKTHVSEPERAAFAALEAAGYTDIVRPLLPGPGVYTYWDYQQLRFPKRQGMRIDFILGTASVAARITAAHIDREERKGKGASDHAPVIVDVDPV